MKYALCILLVLTACQPARQVEEPVIVKVPVVAPCHNQAIAEPDWNVVHLAANAKPTAELQAVLADLDLSKGYIGELKAELEACT